MVVLLVLPIAQLMVILDISAVNVALPHLATDLGIGGGDLGWAITSYSLVFGSLLLLGGRAADLLGRRRVFLAGLGVFTVASLASAHRRVRRGVLRGAGRTGPRRGDAVPRRAVHHHHHLPGRGPREGARRLGRRRRRRRRRRRAARGHAHGARRLAGRSSSSTSPSASRSPSPPRGSSPPTPPDRSGAAWTSAARSSPPRASARSSTPSPRRRTPAGHRCRRWASGWPASSASRRSPRSSCTARVRCSPSRGSASAASAAAS